MSDIAIRFAEAEDCALILEFVRELAAYEKASDAVVATEDDLRRWGFGPNPHFEVLIAFVGDAPVGFALFLPDFSTWRGRPGIFLEDLFVREAARGKGVGRALLARLARIALERDMGALHFNVLDWNPARGFYHRLGLTRREEWLPYGAQDETLERLAAQDTPES
ncbi:MAG TPA: GNAT family N-acetyltransferase [Stellaceae bacterium]